MKEEKKESVVALTVSVILISMIIGGIIAYAVIAPELEYRGTVDHLKDVILDKEDDVSDDYWLGWNDCIQELEVWHRRATNATAQIYELN